MSVFRQSEADPAHSTSLTAPGAVSPETTRTIVDDQGRAGRTLFWLQGVTLVWMLLELGVSAYSAVSAGSPAMSAFASDSLVELLSALIVLFPLLPGLHLRQKTAVRAASLLLYVLAFSVGVVAIASLAFHSEPRPSRAGMGITLAALVGMPVLAWLKRREAYRSGNRALAADAVQSATCAYLALIAFAGLFANALFHIAWLDSAAALVAIPFLIKEARSSWQGQHCACC